ncbi:MAG: FtsW/RodA/SpoVE family cell cycle protein [Bacilli bacterium]|nr:FtsW/RodA/SpoVE family cell cycle protein [Bacilli bacterium]
MRNIKILFILVILMLFSLINNYSAAFIMESYQNYFIKQLIWYIFSFLAICIISKINLEFLFKYSFYFYLLGNFILFLTLFIGTNINGSTSWIMIGSIGFQPNEFMKIALIMYLYNISYKYKDLSDLKYILLTTIITLIPSFLTFLEPDTGAVILYIIILVGYLIIKKVNKFWYIGFLSFILIFGISFSILYYNYQDLFIKIFGTTFFYRLDRVTEFVAGDGYQLNKALTSIGTSGLLGQGLTTIHEYFPEAPTDFAFALTVKNIGIVGIIIFLTAYALFFYLLIDLINSKNKNLVFPVILLLMFQFSVNVLMNIGLFPIIGITLPLISYGGSSLLSYMIIIGLVLFKKENFSIKK